MVTHTETRNFEISNPENLPENPPEVTIICDPSSLNTTPSQFQTWFEIKVSQLKLKSATPDVT